MEGTDDTVRPGRDRAHLWTGLLGKLCGVSNVHYNPLPPNPNPPTSPPPRPLPSCLAQRLKTGTDLVKKQEVMKSGLAQPYQSFSFPPHQPQNSTTPLPTHRTPPLPRGNQYRIKDGFGYQLKGRGAMMQTSPQPGRHAERATSSQPTVQRHLRWTDMLRKRRALPFPQSGSRRGVMKINHRHILSWSTLHLGQSSCSESKLYFRNLTEFNQFNSKL